MRWLPWRRKQARSESVERLAGVAVVERPMRTNVASRAVLEPHGAALTFARDALALSGTQVRVEEPDLLAITLPDGTHTRYTGSLARARAEANTTLLVQGGAALGALLDEVASHAAGVAFALPASGDPQALATAAIADAPARCGRCASGAAAENGALCASCPLRTGRLVLRGVGHVTEARELRRDEALAVELTYRVTCRDRDGRRDEVHRLAYDLNTVEAVTPVAMDSLTACAPRAVPLHVEIAAVSARAQLDLTRTLEAGASLLALRAEAEYQRRLHDLALTHARLLRETPEARAELEAGHAAECARLADLFAVGVEAELVGVVYVSTTLVEVAMRHPQGELTLVVDLGRGMVLPPLCMVCGRGSPAACLCARGHLLCPACAGATRDLAAGACSVCTGQAMSSASMRRQRQDPRRDAAQPVRAFTVERLADLSEPLWHTFVSWYLAAEGYSAEAPHARTGVAVWRLTAPYTEDDMPADGSGSAVAVRPSRGRQLGAADVRAAVEMCRGKSPAQSVPVLLLTSAAADADALNEAAAAGVRLVERDALADFLARAAAAHETALAEADHEAQARAQEAVKSQRAILDALTAVEKGIAASANSRRATGRGPLAAASNTIVAALHEAERALLAWETLVGDWLASFDVRPAPDGSLRIERAPDDLRALADRAEHLRAALERPLAVLASTPGTGESGYTGWRKALLEQLNTRCEAICWRASMVNPAQWRDAAAARDANAANHAESAAQAAKHTAARAAKAHDVLTGRIGL